MKTFLLVILPVMVWAGITTAVLTQEDTTPQVTYEDYGDQTLAAVNDRIRRYPRSSSNFYQRALLLREMGKREEAFASVNQAVELNNGDPRYHFLMAEMYGPDSAAAAIRSAERAASLGLDTLPNAALLADLYRRQGDHARSLTYIDQALAKAPDEADLHYRKAQSLLVKGDTADARRSLTRSLELNADNPKATVTLARIYLDEAQYDQALTYLYRSLQDNPRDADLTYSTAYALRRTGQTDSAQALYQQVLTLESDHASAHSELAFINYSRGRYQDAHTHASQSLRADKENKEALLTLARLNDRQKNYYGALEQYRKIVEIDSTYTPAVNELEKLKGKIAWLRYLEKKKGEGSES